MTLFPEQNITLSCNYSGIPLPNIQWKKDNIILNDTLNDFNINITNATTTLVVNSNRGVNGGLYTCEALNVVGMSSLNYTVHCK